VDALLALVEPEQRGDPESPLGWTTKSTRNLAVELTRQGHRVGPDTVAALLKAEGFSLQATSRTSEGARHPDRDGQFHYSNDRVEEFTAAGQPVVSVDTKKKGGARRRRGRRTRVAPRGPAGAGPRPRRPGQGRAQGGALRHLRPGRRYRLGGGRLRRGHRRVRGGDPAPLVGGEGRHRYPAATRLLLTADAGGANGYRVRAWKTELADFAHATGLEVTVCHFPPGTSKWNKLEHRLCSQISTNWRGRPLSSHEVVVNTIGATATRTGLAVHAELDPGAYPTGVTIPDQVMVALPLTAHDWHGTWNYTLRPRTARSRTGPALRRPHPARRSGPGLAAPSHPHRHGARRVHHPAGRGRAVPPGPPPDQPAPSARPLRRGPLSLSDRLLVTVLHHRWKTQRRALTVLLGSPRAATGDAIAEMTPVLEALGRRITPPRSPPRPHQTLPASSARPTSRASNQSAAPCAYLTPPTGARSFR
jgi:DDE family transposase